ncbi:hypothetical protein TrLO_g10342 [Triparma laevis f. longispina]|uniref:Uncharacterized protein n=1 Tax=Triparma laevis f. longispina TaxID=1714387 RepID=A0A9W6Z7B8_9STRA|nr:hypothetical protein TrLO_g10342 [Triparma laevis f. longispina]
MVNSPTPLPPPYLYNHQTMNTLRAGERDSLDKVKAHHIQHLNGTNSFSKKFIESGKLREIEQKNHKKKKENYARKKENESLKKQVETLKQAKMEWLKKDQEQKKEFETLLWQALKVRARSFEKKRSRFEHVFEDMLRKAHLQMLHQVDNPVEDSFEDRVPRRNPKPTKDWECREGPCGSLANFIYFPGTHEYKKGESVEGKDFFTSCEFRKNFLKGIGPTKTGDVTGTRDRKKTDHYKPPVPKRDEKKPAAAKKKCLLKRGCSSINKGKEEKPRATSGYDLFRKEQCATLKSDGKFGNGNPNPSIYFGTLGRAWSALDKKEQDVWNTKAAEH